MKTVLLVTGDDALRSRLRRPLGDRSVFSAQIGPEALDALQLTEVDLIIADGSTGVRAFVELAARIGGDPSLERVRKIGRAHV